MSQDDFLTMKLLAWVGMDNHHPKGPHVYLGEREMHYDFVSPDRLIEDFWEYVKAEGL